MPKRSGKFYRNNEKEVMKKLGFEPTYNSGSGWVEKEDGENDYLLGQLKSTDAQSIKVNQKDLRILEEHSVTSHKVPVFVIQFLNTNEVWLIVKPGDITDVSKYIETGEKETRENLIDISKVSETKVKNNVRIKSGAESREEFYREKEKRFSKEKDAWKRKF
jgi:Holliday junction resolvase